MAETSIGQDGKVQLPALTGLRAFAALLVLCLHAVENFPNRLADNALVGHGYLGVDLFFILSGFIIAHVYLHELVPLRAQPLRVFLWHRFIRLFPAHAAVLLGLVALVAAAQAAGVRFNEPQGWNWRELPWHFLMVHAWGVTDVAGWNSPSWSISAEWFAYLLFPGVAAAALALPRRAVVPLAFAALLGAALLFRLCGWHLVLAWTGMPPLVRVASEFICGVLLYRGIMIDSAGLSRRQSDTLAFGALLGFCAGASFWVDDFLLVVLLALLIAGASGPGARVRAVFGRRPVVWLGDISYSIYIVHYPVLLVLRHGAERAGYPAISQPEILRITMFLAGIAVAIGGAAVLYYLVETPARRRLRNLFGTIDARPSGIAAMPARAGVSDPVP